jgi:hypothetical protein
MADAQAVLKIAEKIVAEVKGITPGAALGHILVHQYNKMNKQDKPDFDRVASEPNGLIAVLAGMSKPSTQQKGNLNAQQ